MNWRSEQVHVGYDMRKRRGFKSRERRLNKESIMKEETKKQASKRANYWRYRLYKFQELHPELSKREDSKMEFADASKMLTLGGIY